jgi:dTDP-4-dehydrorhamnose reductase
LAEESRRIEAMLVHLSSDQVFSGTKGNYSRGEETCPINGYAKLKATAEDRLCANTAGRIVVLRLPPLLGNSLGGRRSLHERLLASWNERKAVRLFTDEIRQPCSVRNLANAILDLLWVRGAEGIYHWAGREAVSRFELGCLIRRHFGLSEQQAPIIAVTREEERAVATGRPANLTLDLDPLDRMLATRPQTLAEAIADLSLPGWFACSDRRDAPSNPDPQVTSQPCEKPS